MGLLVFQSLEMEIPCILLKVRRPKIPKSLQVSNAIFYSNTNSKVTFEIESIQLCCVRQNFNKEAWKQICSCVMLITWEIWSHPWLGGRDPIKLFIDRLVTEKKLHKFWSYLWELMSSFSFLHECRCWERRKEISEGNTSKKESIKLKKSLK